MLVKNVSHKCNFNTSCLIMYFATADEDTDDLCYIALAFIGYVLLALTTVHSNIIISSISSSIAYNISSIKYYSTSSSSNFNNGSNVLNYCYCRSHNSKYGVLSFGLNGIKYSRITVELGKLSLVCKYYIIHSNRSMNIKEAFNSNDINYLASLVAD